MKSSPFGPFLPLFLVVALSPLPNLCLIVLITATPLVFYQYHAVPLWNCWFTDVPSFWQADKKRGSSRAKTLEEYSRKRSLITFGETTTKPEPSPRGCCFFFRTGQASFLSNKQ